MDLWTCIGVVDSSLTKWYNIRYMISKVCEKCGKRFEKKWNYSRKYFATQKYCSNKCRWLAMIGVKQSPEQIAKRALKLRGYRGGLTKKEWRKLNPEKERLYHRRYREKHQAQANAYSRKYKKEHRARYTYLQNQRRIKIRKIGGSFTFEEWQDLCNINDNKCKICGKETKLTIDHIISISKGGTNDIKNIQPLWLQCNVRKSNS